MDDVVALLDLLPDAPEGVTAKRLRGWYDRRLLGVEPERWRGVRVVRRADLPAVGDRVSRLAAAARLLAGAAA